MSRPVAEPDTLDDPGKAVFSSDDFQSIILHETARILYI
jgi:hypothetical protein